MRNDQKRSIARGTRLPGPKGDAFVVVGDLLGQGGFSEVYLARGEQTGRLFALKILHPERALKPKDIERLQREGKFLYSIRHANLLAVYHVGVPSDGSSAYLIMQLMKGRTVRHFMMDMAAAENRQRQADGRPLLPGYAPMEFLLALDIVIPVCAALTALHDGNAIHRDLKPENVNIEPGGKVLLFDVGIGMFAGASRLTTRGMSLGTPDYMSPEQVMGSEHLDHRSDLFTVGVLLYELLTGRTPFGSGAETVEAQHAQLRRIVNTPHQSLRETHAWCVPGNLIDVVDRLLQKRADDRYQSAVQVRDMLAAIFDQELARHGQRRIMRLSDAIVNLAPATSATELHVPSIEAASENPYVTISLPPDAPAAPAPVKSVEPPKAPPKPIEATAVEIVEPEWPERPA